MTTADQILKELRQIKNLLILQLLRTGAKSEEVDLVVKMGAGNIRRLLPMSKFNRKKNADAGH